MLFVIYDRFPIFEQIDYLWQTLMIRTDAANPTVRNSAHSILSETICCICFEDLCSTDIDAVVSYGQDTNAKVEIMLGGDSELDSMIDALRWAAVKLEDLKNSH